MSRKKIGIVGWNTGDNSFGITKPYYHLIDELYGKPVILSPDNVDIEKVDLVIIPGGPDVDPIRYGQRPNIYTGKPCHIRESFDEYQLPQYIEAGIPIFGICRGHQTLAVHFGAELIQDMYHETNDPKKRGEEVHKASIVTNLKNIRLHQNHNFGINSIHHQTVNGSTVDHNEAIVTAVYANKQGKTERSNHVEAIAYLNHPIASVQWHPEEIWDAYSLRVIRFLLDNREPII